MAGTSGNSFNGSYRVQRHSTNESGRLGVEQLGRKHERGRGRERRGGAVRFPCSYLHIALLEPVILYATA